MNVSTRRAPRAGFAATADALKLETPLLTAVFWAAVAVYALAFWLTKFPPCIDYPEHLALAATLRRWFDASSTERALYEFTPLTYNGLFELSAALLSFVVAPETAGRLLLSAIAPLTASAALAALTIAERPRWYAFFLLPLCYSYAVGWGFMNYVLATPIALLVLTWWMRWLQGEPLLWRVIAGSLLVAYAHVLVSLCLCLSVAIVTLSTSLPRELGVRRWLAQVTRAGLPLLPAIAYSILVFSQHRQAPHINWEPEKDGLDDPAWVKLVLLSRHATGNLADRTDQGAFVVSCVLAAALWGLALFRRSRAAGKRPWLVLSVAWSFAYLVVPRIWFSTAFIYERLPIWLLFSWICAAPAFEERLTRPWRTLAAASALASAVNVAYHFASIPGTDDASAILDAVPAHARVLALTYSADASPAIGREMWTHHLAYVVARRPAEVAYAFTRYASLPLRYRAGRAPPLSPGGLEWNPRMYDPRAAYARAYPWILVRAPDESAGRDPRELTFGPFASSVTLVARRGRFWLYHVFSATVQREIGARE